MKMANEKTESTAIAEYKDHEISDFVDSASAQGTFNAYVYSYKQGGRVITGLSSRAIEHLALEREIDTDPVNLKVEEKDDGVLTTVTAILEIVRPSIREEREDGTIIVTEGYTKKIRRTGINHSPFQAYNKPDPFVYQKSMTKATRNAMSRLIPVTAQLEAKETLLALQGGKPIEVPQSVIPQTTKAKPVAQKTSHQVSMSACFAEFQKHEADLAEKGITLEAFWLGVKDHYKVESRKDMTIEQLKELREALFEGYGKVVRDIIKTVEEEVDTEFPAAEESD